MGCKELEPMQNWVKGEGQGCRPCRVTVGVGKYRKALQAAGQDGLIEVVRAALNEDEDTVVKLAVAMDNVKTMAPPEIKAALEVIDCEIQNKEECGACDAPAPVVEMPPVVETPPAGE